MEKIPCEVIEKAIQMDEAALEPLQILYTLFIIERNYVRKWKEGSVGR